MQRYFDQSPQDAEFPGRYVLDEARFSGGNDPIRNREVKENEPATDLT